MVEVNDIVEAGLDINNILARSLEFLKSSHQKIQKIFIGPQYRIQLHLHVVPCAIHRHNDDDFCHLHSHCKTYFVNEAFFDFQ